MSIIVIDNGEEYSAHELVFLDQGDLSVDEITELMPLVQARWGYTDAHITAIADNVRWLVGGPISVGEWIGCIYAPEKWPLSVLANAIAASEEYFAKNPTLIGIGMANEHAKKILAKGE